MEFKAFKMDGLGNDFVIIDQREKIIKFSKQKIVKICDRNFIGCDQLIIIKKSLFTTYLDELDFGEIADIGAKLDIGKSVPIFKIRDYLNNIDANLEFYNSDGSVSGACGNGTRCVAYFLSKERNKNEITFWINGKIIPSKILGEKLVETKLSNVATNWYEIPLKKELNTINLNYKIIDKNNKDHFGGTAVNVGNPHIIFFVNNIEDFNLEKIGPEIENDKLFPEKCNVTLAKIINENHIKVKVWERGAGLTKACGTAACATAYAAKINGKIKNKTEVEFELGKLSIFIDESKNISMTGPVSNIEKINIKI